MLLLEHRYYGQSHPTPDMGVKNLAWLSSRQVLLSTSSSSTYLEPALGAGGPRGLHHGDADLAQPDRALGGAGGLLPRQHGRLAQTQGWQGIFPSH